MSRRSRQDDAYTAAQMYYSDGDTMEAIASRLRVSRSTVSRLLRDARDSGIVQITLKPPGHDASRLCQELAEIWGVRVHITTVPNELSDRERMERVATDTAKLMDQLIAPDMTIALAWGTTMAAVARALTPRPETGVTVVQLNGAVNTEGGGLGHASWVISQFARAYDAQPHHFAVPAFFDHVETKQALWRERSTRRILDLQSRAHLAVFGVGTFTSGVPSHVYASGYLEKTDLDRLRRQRVVGDICTVFLQEDGTWQDVDINARCSGPSPEALCHIPRRVLVVSGAKKVPALKAALMAGVATDIVVDDITARMLLTSSDRAAV
ncbi:sugar-binding transcriptional regulator [Devriesea agamarum]|uniref:sugar-binding transcriptional regulator n=1 Tax=Devriesea agamarum TaxID=472569 RepID=UPI00071C355C|nr:sugar-binding domain-containing protein [Devriesea agamarum]